MITSLGKEGANFVLPVHLCVLHVRVLPLSFLVGVKGWLWLVIGAYMYVCPNHKPQPDLDLSISFFSIKRWLTRNKLQRHIKMLAY